MTDFTQSRRHFLQATSTIGAAAALGIGSAASADDGSAQVPIIYSAIKGGGIGKDKAAMVARLKELKALGFTGVEGGSPGISDTRALREAVEEVDFPVHGVVDMVHWKERLSSPNPASRAIGVAALEQAIRDSYAVGGSTVLLVAGRVSGDDENHDHVWQRSIVEIRKVTPLASRLGIHVLIENVWNGFCEDPSQFRDYLDEINSPWVGAYFDIGNCRKFGPAEDWVRALGRRIVKLDIKDWGQKNGFCRLGEGDVNWPEVQKSLVEIGFSGWATREGRDKSLEDTVALTKKLLG
ncbi:MAG: sugar phosphate isomerase/epimerase family protein [Pirellulaceae bacterium]|nr:sugar phosphate isomerase/epimerase family protein [Pirellulaceae bacterium]